MFKEARRSPLSEESAHPDAAGSDFDAKCECIRELLSSATREDASARYRVGTHVRDLKENETKYGTRGVARLAERLRRNEATLYRHALVAERWSLEAFTAHLDRQTPSGQPLSWTHFVELSAVEDDARREELAGRAIAEGLSVRALATLIRASSTPPAGERLSMLEKAFRELELAKARMTSALECLHRVEGQGESPDFADLVQIEELQRELQALARRGAELVAQMWPKPPRAVTGTVTSHGKVTRAERNMPTLLCGAVPR